MKKFTTATGFGYFKDENERVVSKYIFTPGSHKCMEDVTPVDVADQVALDAVEVYQDPEELKARRQAEILTQLLQIDATYGPRYLRDLVVLGTLQIADVARDAVIQAETTADGLRDELSELQDEES